MGPRVIPPPTPVTLPASGDAVLAFRHWLLSQRAGPAPPALLGFSELRQMGGVAGVMGVGRVGESAAAQLERWQWALRLMQAVW